MQKKPFLDQPLARWLAALVLLLCGLCLGYIHRDDVLRVAGLEEVATEVSTDPATVCIEQRFAEVDGMIEEGVVGAEQADTFKERAEAMCHATVGNTGAAPPLPQN